MRDKNENICGSVVVFHDATRKKETDSHIQTLTNAVEQTAGLPEGDSLTDLVDTLIDTYVAGLRR